MNVLERLSRTNKIELKKSNRFFEIYLCFFCLSLFQSFNAVNNLNQSNNTKRRNFGLSSSQMSKSSIAAVNNFAFVVSSYDLLLNNIR